MDKVAYVVIREDIESPIIESQVLDVLSYISNKRSSKPTLIWFYRIDYFLRSFSRPGALKKRLGERGIKIVLIPFIAGKFPVSWFWMALVLPQWLIGLSWVWLRYGNNIFHCRSYHAAFAGILFKKLFNVKIVFDPRSPFVEENVAAGKWRQDGVSFRLWKIVERWVAKNSDAIIAISGPFTRHFREISPDTRVLFIPNSYSENPSVNYGLEQGKKKMLCYVGSLGQWNDPNVYLDFLRALNDRQASFSAVKFVIPSSSVALLEQSLRTKNLILPEFIITSVDRNDVLKEISCCTVGLQLMKRPDERLGIKFVEYLGAGVPVIASHNVKGAAEIIRDYGVGIVLEEDCKNLDEVIAFINKVAEERSYWRNKCRKVARNLFSLDIIATQITQLYDSL